MKRKKKTRRMAGGRRRLPRRDLQPLAKPGDALYDGEFIVCSVHLPHGDLFDEDGVELYLHEMPGHEGGVYTNQREPPEYRGVRDWFFDKTGEHPFGVSAMEGRDVAWLKTYEGNRDKIRKAAADLPQHDVVYLVASGPSLAQNAQHLFDVKRGAIMAVNWSLPFIQWRFGSRDLCDYYVCIDFKMEPDSHWRAYELPPEGRWGPYPSVTGVFDVVVNPAVPSLGFLDTYWFTTAEGCGEIYDRLGREKPFVTRYDSGLNVTFSALQVACLGMRAKTVVLVGADCALTWGHHHAGIYARYDSTPPHEYHVTADIHGTPVITTNIYGAIADWTQACFYFMQHHGIRVINATEGGLIANHCELRTLEETVAELNEE